MSLCFFVIFSLIGAVFSDACGVLNTLKSRSDGMSCYQSAPFDSYYESTFRSIATDYSGGSKYYLDFAVYRQHLKAGGRGNEFDMRYDITTEMAALKTKSYTSWFDSVLDMKAVFRNARDAHFTIFPNTIWRRVYFYHPVTITSEVSGGKQIFKLQTTGSTTVYQTYYNTAFGTSHNFASLDGFIIKKIDGKEPIQAIRDLCKSYYGSRDDSTCLNDLIRKSGIYYRRNMYSIALPTSAVSYELENPTTEEISTESFDFITCVVYNSACQIFADNAAFLAEVIAHEPTVSGRRGIAIEESHDPRNERILERSRKKVERLTSTQLTSHTERRATPSRVVLCGDSDSKATYQVYYFTGHSDVLILYLNSFSFENADLPNSLFNCFRLTIKPGGYSKMVFDLRENTGGIVQWGLTLAGGMMKRTMVHHSHLMGPFLMTKHLREDDKWYSVINNYGTQFNNGTLNDVTYEEIDYSISTYDPFVWGKKSTMFNPMKTATGFQGFEPEDLVLLFDGSCGSTCGMYSKIMTKSLSARTVLAGGIYEEDADIVSFEGSAVLNTQSYGVKYTGENTYTFSYSAYFTPTLYGFFDKSKLDFTKMQGFDVVNADHRLYEWTGFEYSDDELVYKVVTDYLGDGKCSSWNIKIDGNCSVANAVERGLYGRPCKNGVFAMDDPCVLKRCEDGYFLNEFQNECIALEDAPLYDNMASVQTHYPYPRPPPTGSACSFCCSVWIILLSFFAFFL